MRGVAWAGLACLALASGSAPSRAQDASVRCGEEVPEADRQGALASYRVGRDLVLAARWLEAEDPLTAAARLDPLLPEPHYALGQALMGLKRYPEAVEAFGRARDAFGCATASEPALRQARRRADDEIRELREAIRKLEGDRLAQSRFPGREANRESPLSLAESRLVIQQLEARLAELERWRKRGGGIPPEVLLALGSAHFNAGSLADAEREYRAALALDPGSGDAHNNLAVVLMLTARLDEAEREVRRAEQAGVPVNPRLEQEIARRRQPQR